jgi:hypothetical protein
MSPHGGARAKPHRVRPHVTRLLPGPDVGHLNALADELEDAVVIARAGTQKRS